MSDFTNLIARAVNPSMSRAERETVYTVAREAVLRLQQQEHLAPDDPRSALQRHLVEETIRDVEIDIVRHLAMETMRRAAEAQEAEIAASRNRRRR